jgi:hypothetical protein
MGATHRLCGTLFSCSALGVLFVSASSAVAEVVTPDWRSLFQSASAITVVHVERVESYAGVRVALATVLEPVSGLRPGQQVAYVAQPGWFWSCDDSNATVGETALLFLEPISRQERRKDTKRLQTAIKQKAGNDVTVLAIACSGLGRLQVKRRGGQWWMTEPVFVVDPPVEFTRQRRGGAVPLAAVRAFAARVKARRGSTFAAADSVPE